MVELHQIYRLSLGFGHPSVPCVIPSGPTSLAQEASFRICSKPESRGRTEVIDLDINVAVLEHQASGWQRGADSCR
jgi:hypothetical protein